MRPYDSKSPAVQIPCERCGAKADVWCRRPSGATAPWQHAARYAALQELEREVHL